VSCLAEVYVDDYPFNTSSRTVLVQKFGVNQTAPSCPKQI